MTLNDLERGNGRLLRYLTEFDGCGTQLRQCGKVVDARPILSATKMYRKKIYTFRRYMTHDRGRAILF